MERPRAEGTLIELAGHGGLRLRAEVCGGEAAPPVLLLHGGGQTRHAWGGTARTLAEDGWCAVSVDLRGHGDSDWAPDGDYAFERVRRRRRRRSRGASPRRRCWSARRSAASRR